MMRKIEKELKRLTEIAMKKLNAFRTNRRPVGVRVVGTKYASIDLFMNLDGSLWVETTIGSHQDIKTVLSRPDTAVYVCYCNMKMYAHADKKEANRLLRSVNALEQLTSNLAN